MASAPLAPIRESFMISRTRALSRLEYRPSKVSESPSRCSPPVRRTSANTRSTAMSSVLMKGEAIM